MAQLATDRELMIEAISRYGRGYDTADFNMLGAAFTADATSKGEVTGTDVTWGPMQGRDEIVSVLKGIRDTHTDQRRHCMTNFIFLSQSESAASLVCNLTLLTSADGDSTVLSAGYYTADLVKDGNTWLIARLDCVLDSPF